MKGLYYNGKDLEYADLPIPVRKAGESLIEVEYAGICNTDMEILKGYMGFHGVPGHEFTGIVKESDDRGLTGRRVTGEINLYCGECSYCRNNMHTHCPGRTVLGIQGKNGCFSEYITLPDRNLKLIPDSINSLNAVFTEPLAAALRPLDQFSPARDSSVCILGDGKLGILSAIVFSNYFDDVLLSGKHVEKLEKAKAYNIKTCMGKPEGRKFDITVDCTGSSHGIKDALLITRPGGTLVLKTTSADDAKVNLAGIVIDEIRVMGSRCGNLDRALSFLAQGIDLEPLISGIFPLEKGLEAFEYSRRKDAVKIIIKIKNKGGN